MRMSSGLFPRPVAMRRPIVSTTADGLGEVLRQRQNALLVAPGDAAGLAAGVLELLEQPALAGALAAQAGTDSGGYDVQRTVDRLQELYLELMDRPR